jgi:hypothetical protein
MRGWSNLSTLIGIVILIGLVRPINAQPSAPRNFDPYLQVSPDLSRIQLQIYVGLIEERRVLVALKGASGPVDVEKLPDLIYSGYAKIRAGENGLRLRMGTADMYQHPFHPVIVKYLNTAMHHIRQAHLNTQAARASDLVQLDQAILNLETAIDNTLLALKLFRHARQ